VAAASLNHSLTTTIVIQHAVLREWFSQVAAASAALAPPPGLAATASDPVFEEVAARARSHCRFRNSSATEYASGSGTKWVGGSTTRQCDRASVRVVATVAAYAYTPSLILNDLLALF
jgi:hypothetical protein